MQDNTNPEKSDVFRVPRNILKQSNPYEVIAAIKLKECYNLVFLGIFKDYPLSYQP